MPEFDFILMSLVIFVPSLFALGLLFFPRGWDEAMRWWALFGTALTLGLSLALFVYFKAETLDFHGAITNPTAENRLSSSLGAHGTSRLCLDRRAARKQRLGRAHALDPALRHRLLHRHRRHQHGTHPAHHCPDFSVDDGELGYQAASCAAIACCFSFSRQACWAHSSPSISFSSTSFGK